MKKIYFCLSATILFTLFTSCNKDAKVEKQTDSISVLEPETIYGEDVDELASPAEGLQDFYKNVASNFVVSDSLVKSDNKNVRLILSFVVEKDGSFSDIKSLRDPGFGAAEEGIRVLKSMPKWNPAKINNSPVRSQFNLPITIAVNDSESDKDVVSS